MARTRPPRKREKVKQLHLDGMEPPSIKEIDEAAEVYRDFRNTRMDWTEKEGEAQQELLSLMKQHKLTTYVYDGYTVSVDKLEKVKVRKNKEESDGE